jgi:hypothetical protein
MDKHELIDLIKADPDVTYLFEVSQGRHFIEVPIERLESHSETLKQARDEDPQNVDLLKSSFDQTGDEPLYHPAIYPEKQADGSVKLFIVDGHQRIRAELANGKERMIVQVLTIWKSINEAFDASISANFARYNVGEADVFSILATRRVGKDKLIRLTGFSDSKIDRLILISEHQDLVPLVKEKLVGPAIMVKLIKVCDKNPEKLEALTNALVSKRTEANEKANEWKNIIRTNKHIKYDKRDKDKRDPKSYFKKMSWDAWEDALLDEVKESDRFVQQDDGSYLLDPESKANAKYVNIRFGDEAEWEEGIAIFGLSGTKRSDIDPTQLKKQIIDKWDEIGQRLEEIYEDISTTSTAKRNERKASTPRRSRKATTPPKQQESNMNIDSSDGGE